MQKAQPPSRSCAFVFIEIAFDIAYLKTLLQALAVAVKNLPRVSAAFFEDHPAAWGQNKHTCVKAL